MSDPAYLLIHKDHPLSIHGVNSGAEMATLCLARYLAREGKRMVVAAQITTAEETHDGIEFWDLGDDFNVTEALARARSELGSYHLISAGRAQAILESRNDDCCVSRTLISHDRSGNDTGIRPAVLARVVDNIICVSHAQSRVFLDAEVPEEKVIVIHNGVDLELFDVGRPESRDYKRLVFVGALVQDKGIHLLIQSFIDLKAKHHDITLDVYGSADLWGREKFIDEEQIGRQVPGLTFHGSVGQDVISEAYKNAGICVVPSIWFDPFPLTALEAQVTGCPVVTFNVGGLPEGVRHLKTGIVLEDISQDALTRCLDELLSDTDRLKKFSKEAIQTAREYFTWDRVVKSVIEVCNKAASKRSSAGSEGSLVEKKLGFLSTWNQECGLATYAGYMLKEFPPDSYVVLAEDSTGDRKGADQSFVERCWKRETDDFEALYAAVKKHDIGLLHLNCHYRFFPQPAFAAFISKLRGEGIKVIAHLHTVFTIDEKLRDLVSAVDTVIVHSPENRLEVIGNGGSPDQVKVVPHGVDVRDPLSEEERRQLRNDLGLPQEDKIICSFGFIQPHKGIEGVIEAVAHLKACGVSSRGCIAGKPNDSDPNSRPYLQQLKDLAAALGVADRVEFLDRFLEDDEVPKYLQAADLVFMNYQSQYYEASGACSLAVGSGALVATSIAPAFLPFGDAVWHITSGYPPGLAAELLLTNAELRNTIKTKAQEYCRQNSWKQICKKVQAVYAELGFKPKAAKSRAAVISEPRCKEVSSAATGLRVLMQNRSNTFTARGGDTVVMEKIIAGLEPRGVEVVVDVNGSEDPANYDLVHLFNFALPDMLKAFGQRAHQAGTPFVVTTLCEDVPIFHNQSGMLAMQLIEYVKNGQSAAWWRANRIDYSRISPSARFENGWIVDHAAALFTNGKSESGVLESYYPGRGNIMPIALGHEIGAQGNAEDFIRAFGVKDFVFCVGRFESRKNQLMLLKALEHSELTVVFAGGGFSYQPDYAEAAKNFRRKGETIILDRVSPEMLASAYLAAKIHVLPSWYELPGLVSLEAAHYGCNVVVTRNGTSPDYLGEAAFYCDPADEMSIYNAVMAAYHSPFRTELKEIAMSYTWDKVAEETLEAYQKVLGVEEKQVEKEVDLNLSSQPVSTETAERGGYDMAAGTTEFQDTLERGELAARNKEYNLALEYLSQALEMDPRSVRALRACGAVYLAENNAAAAQSYFSRALDLDAKDPKTLSGLGMCEMREGSAETAYQYFLKALDLEPYHLVTILQFVECCYIVNRYDDLIRILTNFVDTHPDDLEMKYCLAGALYKQGAHQESERILDEILAQAPNHLGSKQLKDMIREAAETQTEVSSNNENAGCSTQTPVQQSVGQSPMACEAKDGFNDIDNQLTALEEKKRSKDYEGVHRGCNEILLSQEIREDQKEQVRLLLAEVSVLQGDFRSAAATFEEVLSRNPGSARALCGKGALAANRMKWDEAERLFQQAHELDPEYDVPLAGLGLTAAWFKDHEKAWNYYRQALDHNPENIRALLGLLEMGYPLKKLSEVEQAIKTYLEMHPGDLDFIYSLAGCYFAQDRLSDASAEIEKITLFDPDHKKALELKEMIEERINGGNPGL
jgi:glycosyltransferase involved in cell wall biosynthesis/Flp pilus assembly protein TadD